MNQGDRRDSGAVTPLGVRVVAAGWLSSQISTAALSQNSSERVINSNAIIHAGCWRRQVSHNAFDKAFKLVYAKLFDEWQAGSRR
jgi:hypothetical protein